MERKKAEKIMGENFIGTEELKKIASVLNIEAPARVPKIPYSEKFLKKNKKDYILILGVSKDKKGNFLTLNNMRKFFGWDPNKSEPCFYNQDWYLKEKFALKTHLDLRWYFIRKNVLKNTKGKDPLDIQKKLKKEENFPSAILTVFTFFAYYFHSKGEMLWKNDFVWCLDKDHNGDRIYTGHYEDPMGVNKNGFNIHRHLSIRSCYGAITYEK